MQSKIKIFIKSGSKFLLIWSCIEKVYHKSSLFIYLGKPKSKEQVVPPPFAGRDHTANNCEQIITSRNLPIMFSILHPTCVKRGLDMDKEDIPLWLSLSEAIFQDQNVLVIFFAVLLIMHKMKICCKIRTFGWFIQRL